MIIKLTVTKTIESFVLVRVSEQAEGKNRDPRHNRFRLSADEVKRVEKHVRENEREIFEVDDADYEVDHLGPVAMAAEVKDYKVDLEFITADAEQEERDRIAAAEARTALEAAGQQRLNLDANELPITENA